MEGFDIYQDIATRTNGDIYVGVVGPVRTGKSTFIKKFMDLLVLPNMKDEYDKERTKDELPQSGEGKTIMTTEPKFVPNRATQIALADNVNFKVRLVDCVGYRVNGALGYEEDNGPRMVTTPWFEDAIPFQKAAELGTQKVIEDHSTIGLVVTTDGSITDLSRESYVEAEERVVKELNELAKPYIIVLNSVHPEASETKELVERLEEKYNKRIVAVDCLNLRATDITNLLQEVLYEFPLKEVNLDLPLWIDELEDDHWLISDIDQNINDSITDIYTLRDVNNLATKLENNDNAGKVSIAEMDLGNGVANLNLDLQEDIFYKVLEEMTDLEIRGEQNLFKLVRELGRVKKEYDQLSDALAQVKETGYGIVKPNIDDLIFDEPELIRRGGHFGVKLRASAPSIHLIRADINTEVSPVVGTEKQCEELIELFATEFEENPDAIWQSDFLGRSLHDLVKDGINNKLYRMPINAQAKLQDTLQKIVNEGSGGLICIIL